MNAINPPPDTLPAPDACPRPDAADSGPIVDVYRNLNTGGLSGRAVSGPARGRVIWHAQTVLIRNAHFRVQPGGQARARRERQRNVHAFVRGHAAPDADVTPFLGDPALTPVRYNPFDLDGFATPSGLIVTTAVLVVISGGVMRAQLSRPID